jgi:hypothetical protein
MYGRRMLMITCAAVASVSLLAPGDASAATSAKKSFIAAADRICAGANRQIDAATFRAFASVPVGEVAGPEVLASLAATAAPILSQQVRSLRRLAPPKADRATITRLLNDVDAVIAKVVADPSLMMSDVFDDVNARAQRYGFRECGS